MVKRSETGVLKSGSLGAVSFRKKKEREREGGRKKALFLCLIEK